MCPQTTLKMNLMLETINHKWARREPIVSGLSKPLLIDA